MIFNYLDARQIIPSRVQPYLYFHNLGIHLLIIYPVSSFIYLIILLIFIIKDLKDIIIILLLGDRP